MNIYVLLLSCEVGHQRHHQFIAKPSNIVNEQKKKFGFGKNCFSQTVSLDHVHHIEEN